MSFYVFAAAIIHFKITVNSIVFSIGTGASGNCAIAVYHADGNTKLIDTGALTTVTTGARNISVSATSIGPGWYFIAWTADNTSATFGGYAATGSATVLNTGTVHLGTAANASAAGV